MERESEWDGTERAWMLALHDYEASLCPACGLPADECHDPLMPTRWTTRVDVCQTTLMREVAADEWHRDHPDDRLRAGALTTRLIPRPQA